LCRELREEARIELTEPPLLHGVFLNSDASPRDQVIVYVVRHFRVLEEKRADREIAGAGFFPLADLPPDLSSSSRNRINEIVSGQPRAAIW
jgi:8-oxo-dGTP pyrophosphatase MutT (NUDIX family)